MFTVPAPLVRGLSVVVIGAVLVLSHITFATAKPKHARAPEPVGAPSEVDVSSTGSIDSRQKLPENCYWDMTSEVNAAGTIIIRRVRECD
jgi:hypothetical protein